MATYFTHVHELLDIKADKKIYYAQGDQYVFDDPELIEESNPNINLNLDLHKLSSLSYDIDGISTIVNSKNLSNTVISRYRCDEPDFIVPVGTDMDLFYPAEKSKGPIEILVVGPDCVGAGLNPLKFKGITEIRRAIEIVHKSYPNAIVNRISGTPPEIFKDLECNYYENPSQEDLAGIYRKSQYYCLWVIL